MCAKHVLAVVAAVALFCCSTASATPEPDDASGATARRLLASCSESLFMIVYNADLKRHQKCCDDAHVAWNRLSTTDHRGVGMHPGYTLPWANPDVLAVYKVRKTVRTPAGSVVTTSSWVYPYRKYVKRDPSTGQWDYKSLTLKKGCTLTFDWTVPANKSKPSQSRGVATSRISGAASGAPSQALQPRNMFVMLVSGLHTTARHMCRDGAVCNITKGRYTYLTLAKPKSKYSVKLSSKGVVYFWDTYGECHLERLCMDDVQFVLVHDAGNKAHLRLFCM